MTKSVQFHSIYRKAALIFAALFLISTPYLKADRATAASSSGDSLATLPADELNWRQKFGTFRVGIVGGKHAVRRTKLAQPFRLALEKALGLPVEIFAAADYQSLALAHADARVEYAVYSATAFARAWVNCKCIEPLAAPRATDGTVAFQSILVARSGIAPTLNALEGKVIAVPGKTSFSGYNYPKQNLLNKGVDLGDGRWKLSFQNNAASSKQAYLTGKADALFGWRPYRSGTDEAPQRVEDTRGTLFQLAQAKDKYNVVWQSDPIPHGPHAIRKGLAPEARQLLVWFLDGLNLRAPEAYDAIDSVMGGGFQPITLDAYRPLINDLQKPTDKINSEDIEVDKAELASQLRTGELSLRQWVDGLMTKHQFEQLVQVVRMLERGTKLLS